MSIERPEPPHQGGEAEQLLGWLEYQRATLLLRCEGLVAEQLRRPHPPSAITLGGMLKHVAYNEDYWFCHLFAGFEPAEPWRSVDWAVDRDWDWHSAADDSPEELRTILSGSVARARAAVEGADLAQPAARATRRGEVFNLRWIVVHMIEEYARHNGHADLIRESIDGVTGD